MSTRLTRAAASSKQLAIAFVVIVVLLIIARFIWTSAQNYIASQRPTPTPIVNAGYGILPKLPVTETTPTTRGLKIELNTPDLGLPIVTYSSPIIPVYKFKERKVTFNFIENTRTIGQAFGFSNVQPQQIGNSPSYRLTNDVGAVLDIGIEYYNVNYELQNRIAYVPIEQNATISESTAKSSAQTIFNSIAKVLEVNLSESNLTHDVAYSFLNLDNSATRVSSQAQANLTTIYLYRNPISTIPFIDNSLTNPNIQFTYTQERATVTGGSSGRARLLSSQIKYWTLDNTSVTSVKSYPIKSIAEAYQDITNGTGFVLSPVDQQSIYQITRAYLAYFNPENYAPYVIPIWVFEGDTLSNTSEVFRAITPAVARGYIEE